MDKKIDEIIQDIESLIKEEEHWRDEANFDHEFYQSKGAIRALEIIVSKIKEREGI